MSKLIKPASDTESVLIIASGRSIREGFEEHGPSGTVKKTVHGLREDYDSIVSQVLAMTMNTPEDSVMKMKQIEIGLGFSAEGKLGFVASASAGVEATITLTFERSFTGGLTTD